MERERRVMSKVFMSGLEIEEGFGVEGKLFGREVQDFCGSFCDVGCADDGFAADVLRFVLGSVG